MMNSPPELIDPPLGLIEEIARANNIELENASSDCLLLVYALTFNASQKILEKKFENVSKSSIERIRCAFEEMHIKFGYLKGDGEIKGKKYSDVEHIRPLMETVLGHLIAVLDIHDQTKPDPPPSPEKMRLRREALRM